MLNLIHTEEETVTGVAVQLQYDYSQIEESIREDVQNDAAEMLARRETATADLLEMGRILEKNKERLPYGQYTAWVEQEFGFSDQTARTLRNRWELYRRDPDAVNMFGATVSGLLAQPSTPDEVIEKAKAKAGRGERVTKKDVFDLRNQAAGKTPHSQKDSYDSDEYYTPEWLADAVRQVFFGRPHLDPASCEAANAIMQADDYYTKEDNGLDPKNEWLGRVWLNPPYSNPAPFVKRLIEEYAVGNVSEALIIVNDSTDTGWYKSLSVFPKCELNQRVHFMVDGGDGDLVELKQTRQGQTVFYLGDTFDHFSRVFGQFGRIYQPPAKTKTVLDLKLGTVADQDAGSRTGSAADDASRCIVCNRPLTDPVHMAAGIGPVCAAHAAEAAAVEERKAQSAIEPDYPIIDEDFAVMRLSRGLMVEIAKRVLANPDPIGNPALAQEFDSTIGGALRAIGIEWTDIDMIEEDQDLEAELTYDDTVGEHAQIIEDMQPAIMDADDLAEIERIGDYWTIDEITRPRVALYFYGLEEDRALRSALEKRYAALVA